MGRPWPQPGEPLFTAEDTALAVALQEVEDSTCSGCHQPVNESFDPANAEAYDVRRPICFACRAREAAAEAARESNADTNGMRFVPHLPDDD